MGQEVKGQGHSETKCTFSAEAYRSMIRRRRLSSLNQKRPWTHFCAYAEVGNIVNEICVCFRIQEVDQNPLHSLPTNCHLVTD